MYLAFLDEFGHIGPFRSRADRRYNQSPVFGLAGYLLPHHQVRRFATWFFNQKNLLLAPDIRRDGVHPATWEKKGNDLFTTKNVTLYPNVVRAFIRLINKVRGLGGSLFFHGREKYLNPADSNPTGLYTTVLAQAIRNLDRFCQRENETFLIILDEHDSRVKLLETAAKTMFGSEAATCLLEPPFQVESHLYQTIQAADWIGAVVGRVLTYRLQPQEYQDWAWAERMFGKRIDMAAAHSFLLRAVARN